MKKSNFSIAAEEVIEALGGKENVKDSFHCATRLRIYVYDKNKIDNEKLKKTKLLKGSNWEGEQLQLIFGPGTVNKVSENFEILTGAIKNKKQPKSNDKFKWDKRNKWYSNSFLLLRYGVRYFADIFIPLIPIFIAGGIALALNSFIGTVANTNTDTAAKNAALFFEIIGGAILGSLPAFIGFTSMRKFGGNPFLGLAIGLILIAPNLINSWLVTAELFSVSSTSGIANGSSGANGTIAAIALFPNLPEFFSFRLVGYQAQVFPVLAIVYMAYWIERGLKKYTPEFLAIVLIPIGVVFISTFLGFWIIGPIFKYVAIGLAYVFENLFIYTNFPYFGFGGAVFGFVYPFLVVTGLHQGLLPIEATLIAQSSITYGQGITWITPIATVSNISQGMAGLAIAILFIIKKKKLSAAKSIPGAISANLGITEPILFGVNIPLKFVFIAGDIASAFGGYYVGMTHTVANSLGSASFLGFIQFNFTMTDGLRRYYENINKSFDLAPGINIVIASLISTLVAFVSVFLLSRTKWGKKSLAEWYNDNPEETAPEKIKTKGVLSDGSQVNVDISPEIINTTQINSGTIDVMSPTKGQIVSLEELNDGVFSEQLLGSGVAIRVDKTKKIAQVHAPIDGQMVTVFDTKHAYGIRNDNGLDLLIHIGIDTVKLKGKGFRSHVKQDQIVKKGDLIAEFNIEYVSKNSPNSDVIVIALSESELNNVDGLKSGSIDANQFLFKVN
ncbi:PTS system sucrose-specific IIC component [Mycoplasma testudineum]|uniref:PTS system sucrose-specific IIC component n=1 Tax=Mycoplasma testudineum TaxID=244584 RepID=A0A4R6IFQ8_9MOLU|nr:glucose PTS transporter subunit IIA [Mycoplasma testudineum]TDO20561.1 PTS system sucrose-specific IIC component [Mycoplasma testudineum]